jgi:sulfite reductase (NADPH) flavoprotein alpha-component
MSEPGLHLSLTDALRSAEQSHSLDNIEMVRRFRGGTVLIRNTSKEAKQLLVVTDQSVTTINPDQNLIKTLHEGTWAGPVSGTINLLGALALGLLSVSGSLSWLRRRRRMKQRALLATA